MVSRVGDEHGGRRPHYFERRANTQTHTHTWSGGITTVSNPKINPNEKSDLTQSRVLWPEEENRGDTNETRTRDPGVTN